MRQTQTWEKQGSISIHRVHDMNILTWLVLALAALLFATAVGCSREPEIVRTVEVVKERSSTESVPSPTLTAEPFTGLLQATATPILTSTAVANCHGHTHTHQYAVADCHGHTHTHQYAVANCYGHIHTHQYTVANCHGHTYTY